MIWFGIKVKIGLATLITIEFEHIILSVDINSFKFDNCQIRQKNMGTQPVIMPTNLEISETVIDRLLDVKHSVTLKLYGVFYQDRLTIVGLQSNYEEDCAVAYSFPAEVDFCGIAVVRDIEQQKENIIKCVTEVDVTDNPVLVQYDPEGGRAAIRANLIINDNIEPASYTIISEKEINYDFTLVRVQSELPFTSEFSKESIKSAFISLRSSVATGRMVFHFTNNNVYLLSGDDTENSLVNSPADSSIHDMSVCTDEAPGKKKKSKSSEINILPITMLQRVTKNGSPENSRNHGPLCILDKKHCKTINIIIPVDALAMLHKQTQLTKMYEILVETVNCNLRLYEKSLLDYFQCNLENPLAMSCLGIFHFYPNGCGHFVSVIYPEDNDEDSLYAGRQSMHEQLLLSLRKPMFRKSNKYVFSSPLGNNGNILISPHEGLKPSDIGGDVALVKGKYLYYHYGQDKMDDKGWGCAYRSLQTLASWYIMQGYCDIHVPTFKDIQKCLVDIGDKQSDFIGSTQWIGSTEVNYVLSVLLGITSKILYVQSGNDLVYKAPEILLHFQINGSPIMIGGGVLAHTILGIDYNRDTGAVKFLVLDPHYTGEEDLHIVQSKGWCGWKNVTFWDKSAYYNLCMPQVTVTI